MTKDLRIETLSSVDLFKGCTDKELRMIAGLCSRVDVGPGFVLTRQGRPGTECMVIEAGEAEVVIDGETVCKVGPGQCVGEMSLLDNGPQTATVTAITPMRLWVMSMREFYSLMNTFPLVSRKIAATLSRRLRGAETSKAR